MKDQPAGSAFNADIGVELPLAVELRAVPDELIARVPQTKDYQYAVANNRVLLVSPPTRIVVGVFPDVKETEAEGEGGSRLLVYGKQSDEPAAKILAIA